MDSKRADAFCHQKRDRIIIHNPSRAMGGHLSQEESIQSLSLFQSIILFYGCNTLRS